MADKIVKKVKKVAKKVAAKGAEIKADIQNVKNPLKTKDSRRFLMPVRRLFLA